MLVEFMLDVHEYLLSKQLQKQNIVFSEIQPLMDATLGQLNFLESHDGQCLTTMRGTIKQSSLF